MTCLQYIFSCFGMEKLREATWVMNFLLFWNRKLLELKPEVDYLAFFKIHSWTNKVDFSFETEK